MIKYDLDILKIISNDIPPKCGRILISEPLLCDDVFSRSVVLLTDYFKDSFMGLVLNKPYQFKLHEMLDGINNTEILLYSGGPVDRDILYFLHKFSFIDEAVEIIPGLFLGGNVDQIFELINSGMANNSNLKAFVGCSGWAPGQLEEEILFNSWLVAETNIDFVFNNDSDLWKKSLDFVDSRYQIWKLFPIDPDLN
ncbi:MAG: YqgE/AlgH family protein [Bacteroidales bacterium]|jgi:putative transcriptional regulator|nr:YqgE/AlgH family protein [Bacteroidales bacterium]HOL98371.1 YqgE/AlgH family protein [Bacteroidales bacterium]HOM36784.1 YqgE/AlgH family protein [Bacteroidales bacterium]HPD24630.1 YqgE/AlgH family protein [Bacteroidales bacterium]HRS99540.1 YqgE/AlgH family protein [Bacteroidales bacterium]